MKKPLINILVRTSNRPKEFQRMMRSIERQTYKNIRVIVSYDDDVALSYIPEEIEKVRVFPDKSKRFFYDEYVNFLKEIVVDGYFFVLDDSDVIDRSDSVARIAGELRSHKGIVCQFLRKGRPKPDRERIAFRRVQCGKIGMPCLVLHHSQKDVSYLDGSLKAPDYSWIKEVSKKIKLKFIPLVLVRASDRDNGKM